MRIALNFFAVVLALASATVAPAQSLPDAVLEEILDTYAGNIYRRGEATAVVAGITLNGRTVFQSFGHRSADDRTPANAVDEHAIFEIGSVTKVWTTALAGQALATGGFTSQPVNLFTALGRLPGPLPGLNSAMQPATLGDLASFTAGLPDVGDTNGKGSRPSIAEWGVADFVAAVTALSPQNYQTRPPKPSGLPAPYFYSDWSTGLLGLLVTNALDAPLPADAVNRWETAVMQNLVTPLGLADTYLFAPGIGQAGRVVKGYEQATAVPVVNSGTVSAITLKSSGGRYSAAPEITIEQSGGSGAQARAVMSGTAPNLTIKKIIVTNGGRGYRAAPRVTFSGPGSGATGQAIIRDGGVVGVQILSGGSGYLPGTAIQFTNSPGSGATAQAVVSGGKILGAVVTAAGSGYREPPVVRIPPGDHIVNTVPVWAAAGALKSSARDLLRIAQLYLGQPEVGGQPVPPALTAGARYALQPLVQNAPAVRTEFTGMTWEIDTGPIAGGLNALAGKDGALPGFATYVTLVPAVNLGVVILRSNNQAGQAEYADPIGDVANAIALAVQLALMAEESP